MPLWTRDLRGRGRPCQGPDLPLHGLPSALWHGIPDRGPHQAGQLPPAVGRGDDLCQNRGVRPPAAIGFLSRMRLADVLRLRKTEPEGGQRASRNLHPARRARAGRSDLVALRPVLAGRRGWGFPPASEAAMASRTRGRCEPSAGRKPSRQVLLVAAIGIARPLIVASNGERHGEASRVLHRALACAPSPSAPRERRFELDEAATPGRLPEARLGAASPAAEAGTAQGAKPAWTAPSRLARIRPGLRPCPPRSGPCSRHWRGRGRAAPCPPPPAS